MPPNQPGLATQANQGLRSRGSNHGSDSQRAGAEKRAGERNRTLRSNQRRYTTHYQARRPSRDRIANKGPNTPAHHVAATSTWQQPTPMWMWSVGSHQEQGCQPWQLAHPTTSTSMHTPVHQPAPHNTHHPRWHQPIPAFHAALPTTPSNTHHTMPPHIQQTEEEPPIPAQQPTPPITHHTHARHAWEMGHNTHTHHGNKGGGGQGVHDALATRRTERGNGQAEGCYVPPSGKRPRKWTSQGPKAAVGERAPTAGMR